MNILDKNMEVFVKILNLASDREYPVILSGSTSLALQGVNIEVHDIDIVTDKVGALALDRLLKDYNTVEMKYSGTDKYQSYFGAYEIDGVKVEIMGEFQYKLKTGEWSLENHLHDIHFVMYDGAEIPVLSLEQELVEYENADKIVTIEKIKEKLCNRQNKRV